ncbi:hypothetical protein CAOG_08530 [Capsaspora owczarzaki ATCC 30864]|uniref:hypothetical protein n=1 Tax=Capsaspora owczarzaki (strain ATCC 30864) TaxID=595528 RepID=UPI0003523276|nr:hypothetical protein CAOG_08530 [Capsaspora owczarzaki ATCC 30864]|eukprot:XP_011270111.1 hypothetical protein CAOG_08530 [Capsaspora owczarzaki ATCC 30864]
MSVHKCHLLADLLCVSCERRLVRSQTKTVIRNARSRHFFFFFFLAFLLWKRSGELSWPLFVATRPTMISNQWTSNTPQGTRNFIKTTQQSTLQKSMKGNLRAARDFLAVFLSIPATHSEQSGQSNKNDKKEKQCDSTTPPPLYHPRVSCTPSQSNNSVTRDVSRKNKRKQLRTTTDRFSSCLVLNRASRYLRGATMVSATINNQSFGLVPELLGDFCSRCVSQRRGSCSVTRNVDSVELFCFGFSTTAGERAPSLPTYHFKKQTQKLQSQTNDTTDKKPRLLQSSCCKTIHSERRFGFQCYSPAVRWGLIACTAPHELLVSRVSF